MDLAYLLFFIAIFLSVTSLAAKDDNNESNRIPNEKSCGIRIGCYNASVTKPRCGNGVVTFSPDLNYTAEFKITGCDGRRIEGVPVVSWREIRRSADDNELTQCRNQYQCSIPIGVIQRRIGKPLVLEIWTSVVPIHNLVKLGIVLNIRPPVGGVLFTKRGDDLSAKTSVAGTKTSVLGTKSRTMKTYSIGKPYKRPSNARTYEDLVLDHLISSSTNSRAQEKDNRSDRIPFSRIPSRSIENTEKHKSRKKKTRTNLNVGAATEMSVWGTVERINTTSFTPKKTSTSPKKTSTSPKKTSTSPSPKKTSTSPSPTKTSKSPLPKKTSTSPNGAESKNSTKYHSSRIKIPTAMVNASHSTNVAKIHNNLKVVENLSVHREAKPSSLNVTLTKHGTWTRGGKSKLKILRKMEIKIKSNISDANTVLDSILTSTSQKGKPTTIKNYSGYVHTPTSGKIAPMVGIQKHTIGKLMNKCVEFLCGKQTQKGRCPKSLVLQCLHLSSGERRQLMLGDIKNEVQQLIDMFNVSKSDLKEIGKSAKDSAHQLMMQRGNADMLSKKIGIGTAEILRKLYNASYLASRAAITERFGSTGEDTGTGSIQGFEEEWSNWSPCSASCGAGVTTRSRACPSKTANCLTKPRHESRVCTESACHKVHQQLSMPWSSWSSCSVTCGLGQETRSRECDGGSGGQAKRTTPPNRDRCKGQVKEARLCILSSCNADSSTWRKTVLLGFDTVLSCGKSRPWSTPQTYWITPSGNKVSRTAHLPRIYMVSDTLVIHGAQKSDEGVYHCIVDQQEPSKSVTTDTRIEVLTCSSEPCENGGTCKEQRYSFHKQLRQVSCSCRKGYGGLRCEEYVIHSHFRLYVLVASLIGLLVSSLLGFLVYLCAYRKRAQDPKKSKKKDAKNKSGKEPQIFEPLVEEPDVSTNLDSSIVHSDDSWIQISEKDYQDFQEQTTPNLNRQRGPVSRSLPTLNALSFKTKSASSNSKLQRKSSSNTENCNRDIYGDMQPESNTRFIPEKPHGKAYEVSTSPEIKSKILLIQPDRKSKSVPDFKVKKTVSFQVEGVSDNKQELVDKNIKSIANRSAYEASLTQRPGQQTSATTSPHQMSPAASSIHKTSSTSPAEKISTDRSVRKISNQSTKQMSTNGSVSSLPADDKYYVDMSGGPQSGIGQVQSEQKKISTDRSDRKISNQSTKQISKNGSVSSLPADDKDYVDMGGGRLSEKELVIVTSDSIIGLQGDKTNRGPEANIKIVHRRTFSPHEQHHDSKFEECIKLSEEDTNYTPVYYTYQPFSADKNDLYLDMCEFVHRKTYFPEEDVQQAQSEHYYVNLMDRTATYPNYDIPFNRQTMQDAQQETNMAQAISQDDCGLKTSKEDNDEDGVIFTSSNPEELSLDHEANSSNHSYTDDQNILDQIISDSEQPNISTSLDNVHSAEYWETNTSKLPRKQMPSSSFDGDDECYESDQSSTLCPMPDIDGSGDDGSWDTTLKHYSFNQTRDSTEGFDDLVKCFENPRSFYTTSEMDIDSMLPNDKGEMTSTFDVSLGELLDGVNNDSLFGQISSDNGHNSSLSSFSDTAHRTTEATKSPSNGMSNTEIYQHTQSSSTFDNENSDIQQQAKTYSLSSPRTRMCRGHYEMVYGPVSYPSPINQLDSEPRSDVQEMTTEVETLPFQAYPAEHHYGSKSNSDFH